MTYRVPSKKDISFGMLRQKSLCIDTLGRTFGGSVTLYSCHNAGGNQVLSAACLFELRIIGACCTVYKLEIFML